MISANTSTTSPVIKIIGMLHYSPKPNTTPRQWIPPPSLFYFSKIIGKWTYVPLLCQRLIIHSHWLDLHSFKTTIDNFILLCYVTETGWQRLENHKLYISCTTSLTNNPCHLQYLSRLLPTSMKCEAVISQAR
jgi:hypothetical protein